MSELLPCPFCNSIPKESANGGIRCSNHNCLVGYHKLSFSPETWNTRAPAPNTHEYSCSGFLNKFGEECLTCHWAKPHEKNSHRDCGQPMWGCAYFEEKGGTVCTKIVNPPSPWIPVSERLPEFKKEFPKNFVILVNLVDGEPEVSLANKTFFDFSMRKEMACLWAPIESIPPLESSEKKD